MGGNPTDDDILEVEEQLGPDKEGLGLEEFQAALAARWLIHLLHLRHYHQTT